MSKPTARSMARMKRFARYLLEHPRTTIVFRADGGEWGDGRIDVYSDSDWASCPRRRRSTTGGVLVVDGGVVKSWSSMQSTIAQSSGEAEYYAMVRAAAEALNIQSIMRDMGWEAGIRLWVDSSAAKSMASRIGLGKVRHMEVKFLWLQEAVKKRGLEVRKIPGDVNPADILTKPKSVREVAPLLRAVGVHIRGRLKDEQEEDCYEDWGRADRQPQTLEIARLIYLPTNRRQAPPWQHGRATGARIATGAAPPERANPGGGPPHGNMGGQPECGSPPVPLLERT